MHKKFIQLLEQERLAIVTADFDKIDSLATSKQALPPSKGFPPRGIVSAQCVKSVITCAFMINLGALHRSRQRHPTSVNAASPVN